MEEKMIKPKSEHLTAFDVNETQKKLLRFIYRKINGEKPYLSGLTEQEELQDLCQGSFMSQGVECRVIPRISIERKNGSHVVVNLGKDIHNFATNVMMRIKSPTVILETDNVKVTINSRDLWKRFDYYVRYIQGDAIAEAWGRSHEMPKSKYQTAGYGFKPTDRLEERE